MKKQIIILVLFAFVSVVQHAGAGSRVAVDSCPRCSIVPTRCPIVFYCGSAPVYYYYSPGDGFAVRTQMILARMGYFDGEIDGEIGPLSRRAIRRYQAVNGLSITGSVDGPLLRSLGIR